MLRRVRQFASAGARPTGSDLALAARWLDGEIYRVFADQHPFDVVHGVRTATWLLSRGHDGPDLVVAALVHDMGKGRQRRLDRVAYVLAAAARVDGALADPGSRLELRRALTRSRDHAVRGAEMARAAGASERAADLVRRHHSPAGGDAMLALLQEADAAS